MEGARAVLGRLERIQALDRAGAGRAQLLDELEALVDEATRWSREEGGAAGERAVERLRSSLDGARARDPPASPVTSDRRRRIASSPSAAVRWLVT